MISDLPSVETQILKELLNRVKEAKAQLSKQLHRLSKEVALGEAIESSLLSNQSQLSNRDQALLKSKEFYQTDNKGCSRDQMQDTRIFQIYHQSFKFEILIPEVEVEVIVLCHQVILDLAIWMNQSKKCGSNSHFNQFSQYNQ